jgi:hypothetical protein
MIRSLIAVTMLAFLATPVLAQTSTTPPSQGSTGAGSTSATPPATRQTTPGLTGAGSTSATPPATRQTTPGLKQ